jgi:hypothetical protein
MHKRKSFKGMKFTDAVKTNPFLRQFSSSEASTVESSKDSRDNIYEDDISSLSHKELVLRLRKLQILSNNDKELIDILRAKLKPISEELEKKQNEIRSLQRNYENLSNFSVTSTLSHIFPEKWQNPFRRNEKKIRRKHKRNKQPPRETR